MLFRTKDVRALEARALDGVAGKIADVYFDDRDWVVRYFLVETPSAFSGEALISVQATLGIDWAEGVLALNVTREQMSGSPPVPTELPFTREFELQLHAHYGWPPYWTATRGFLPVMSSLDALTILPRIAPTRPLPHEEFAFRIRSARAFLGYHVPAEDAPGRVDDLLISDKNWSVEHLVVETCDWQPGRKVVLPTEAVGGISTLDKRVWLELGEDELMVRPELRGLARVLFKSETAYRRSDTNGPFADFTDVPSQEND